MPQAATPPFGSLDPAAPPPGALLDVRAVAALLGCSPRHVYRLADGDRMPRPVHVGALVRWRRTDIEAWIAQGCQPARDPAQRNGRG